MTATYQPADEPFFAEWKARRPGERRNLERARLIAEHLGALPQTRPVLTVVGSKGKGTAAIYASATLAAAGFRVGLLTSPALVVNNERIRVDGTAVDDATYTALAGQLRATLAAHPHQADGYLSPTGAYQIVGHAHFAAVDVDVIVCEEGLGGRSDEVSLFEPAVVALTTVFREHADLLGDTVTDIAADLLGVATPATHTIVSLQQSNDVEAVLAHVAAGVGARIARPEPLGHPAPAGLSAMNAELGVSAALALCAELGAPVDPTVLADTLAAVHLPGRLSLHVGPGGGTFIVDGAISPAGVRAALTHAHATFGDAPNVIASFPDDKDVENCYRALGDADIRPVRPASSHVHFDPDRHPAPVRPMPEVFAELDRPGQRTLACGTISFVGDMLAALGADCRTVHPPRHV